MARPAAHPKASFVVVMATASGCALGPRYDDRILAELERANDRAEKSEARVVALEARIARIEGDPQPRAGGNAGDPRVLEKLDELIAVNHALLSRTAEPALAEAAPHASKPTAATAATA